METYLVVHEDNSSSTIKGEWELKAYLETLIQNDMEYTIFQQTRLANAWEQAEFYCKHGQYVMTNYGGFEEDCENMSNDPFGCWEHREAGH